tara:strand:+ start:871 stop:1308 length:438 start_codon:yes stop_codon:yes gene_type:complete
VADSFIRNKNGQFCVPGKENEVVGRRTDAVVEARRQKLYRRQLEGLTVRQLVLDHQAREGISRDTAWADWRKVKEWNSEDWKTDREDLLPRLQGMRIRLFEKAMKKGQLQTAAQVLDSLGRVIGESVENVNINAPQLSIQVEPKN